MSSTRHADAGSPFRQERFCSSPELNHGLMANLVAKRCSILSDPLDRELIWFLQYLSHERGLKRFANELLELHPEQIATKAMQQFGLRGKYVSEQVREVRREMPSDYDPLLWPERQARLQREAQYAKWVQSVTEGDGYAEHPSPEEPDLTPKPVELFLKPCRQAAGNLADYLAELCLNPALAVEGPWYLPNLVSLLRAYMEEWQMEHAARVVETEVSRRVIETLDYSLNMRCMTLTEGIEGLGKTWSAENFCLQRPGRARYFQCPATNDDGAFFRELARTLGVPINLKSKVQELRQRVEEVAQTGDFLLVCDESQWLFGTNSERGHLPSRILWLLTQLVNKGCPVALVATPQFEANRAHTRKHSRWRDGQLTGRIDHHEKLPATLSQAELVAVVRAKLPAADDKSVTAIADFARNSERCLGALSAVARRAKFLAQKNGRTEPSRADIKAVILEKGFNATPAPALATSAAPLPSRGSTPAVELPPRRAGSLQVQQL